MRPERPVHHLVIEIGRQWRRHEVRREAFRVFRSVVIEALVGADFRDSQRLIAQDGAGPTRGRLEPLLTEDLWLAKAAPRELTPPHIALSAQRSQAGHTVTLTATPRSGGRYFRILLRSSRDLTNLTIDGRAVPTGLPRNTWSQVTYHAPGNSAVTLVLQAPAGPGQLEVKVIEVRDGWPSGAEPAPRPENVLAFRKSDSTWIAAGSVVEWR